MTQINLLPWREQARQRKKINFLTVLGMFVGSAILLILLLHLIIANQISYQNRKNAYIEFHLNQENGSVSQLKKEKKAGGLVYGELQFIYGLKNSSYKAVRLLDTLVRIMPEGVVLTKIIREQDNVTLLGTSTSNLQVTQLMENITKSGIFHQPVLTEISGKDNEGSNKKYFQIKVVQGK